MSYPFMLEVNDRFFSAEFVVDRGQLSGRHFFFRHDRELFPEVTLGQFIFRVSKIYERYSKG